MCASRISFLVAGVAMLASYAEPQTVTLRPETTREALVNPGMGFCHYAYAGRLWAYGVKNPSFDTLDWFPGCSTVYMRLHWCDLEPLEGAYRWDILDRYVQPWAARGKKVAFRVICCNQVENAVPDFVREAGATGDWFKYTRHKSVRDFPPRWEPRYDDPIFLKKFEMFLSAFAKRYDGDSAVAFVDVGSFGLYGEGHSESLNGLRNENEAEYNRLAKIHLDLWRKHFVKSYLVVSDDIGGSWNEASDHPLMAYCRENGIGFRDDSLFCAPPPDSWKHAHWARLFAPLTPVVLETGHCDYLQDSGLLRKELLLKSVEDHQASYFSIHDYPELNLKLYQNEIEAINQRLGYRFVLQEVNYPSEVVPDQPVTIRSTWLNAGVALCHAGAVLAWSLIDEKGNVCWSVTDATFDFKSLLPTLAGVERPQDVESRVVFGHTVRNSDPDNCLTWARQWGRDPGVWNVMLPSGKYVLCVSVGDRKGTPTIALPLKNGRPDRRYPLGIITVSDSHSTKKKGTLQ